MKCWRERQNEYNSRHASKVKALQQKAVAKAKAQNLKPSLPKSLGHAVQLKLLEPQQPLSVPKQTIHIVRNSEGVQKGQEECQGQDCTARKSQDKWGRVNAKGLPMGLLCRKCATKRDAASRRNMKHRAKEELQAFLAQTQQ